MNNRQNAAQEMDTETKIALSVEEGRKLMEEQDARFVDTSDETEKALIPYTDGVPYDRSRIINEIRFFMNQTVQGIVETGKRFIVLKEREGHGNFIKCLDELDISRYTAWRFMTIARKLANVSRIQHLQILDLKKGIGKLYAFLDVPDDELKEFEETGELRGLTLDEIEILPVSELRDRLRKKNKQIDQGTLQLNDAYEKIKSLEQEIQSFKNPKSYTSDEEKYLDIIHDLGMNFEMILLDIKTKIAYNKNTLPEICLKKLYYLLLFIQKETLDERLRLSQVYENAEGVEWEPIPEELPSRDELYGNLPHMEKIIEMMKRKQSREGKATE